MTARSFVTLLYVTSISVLVIVIPAGGNHLRRRQGNNILPEWSIWWNVEDEDGDQEISPTEWPIWTEDVNEEGNPRLSEERFRSLQADGNVTVPSDTCTQQNRCEGHWGPWETWSDCNLAVPGHNGPKCHNTLHLRKRYCARSEICHVLSWEFCAHRPSCTGEWTPWSDYVGNCSVRCSKKQTRNRTCVENGEVAPGLCFGSGSTAIQTETIKCRQGPCEFELPFKLKLGLIIGSGGLLLIILVIVITSCAIAAKKQTGVQRTSLVSSSSFLLEHWRIISRRITGRARSERERQGNHEVAICNDYSDIHVYENPNDYPHLQDSTEENIHENKPGDYNLPCDNQESRSRRSYIASEDRYAEIGAVGPYASMESLNNPAIGKVKGITRAQSCDNVIMGGKNLNIARPLPGQAMNALFYRGASHLPAKKSKGVTKTPSSVGSKGRNGVVARVTKNKRIANKQIQSRSNISGQYPSGNSDAGEDRYGYLVPNENKFVAGPTSPKKKTKTFSGIENSTLPFEEQARKSLSLPLDIDTYVTMKGFGKAQLKVPEMPN